MSSRNKYCHWAIFLAFSILLALRMNKTKRKNQMVHIVSLCKYKTPSTNFSSFLLQRIDKYLSFEVVSLKKDFFTGITIEILSDFRNINLCCSLETIKFLSDSNSIFWRIKVKKLSKIDKVLIVYNEIAIKYSSDLKINSILGVSIAICNRMFQKHKWKLTDLFKTWRRLFLCKFV